MESICELGSQGPAYPYEGDILRSDSLVLDAANAMQEPAGTRVSTWWQFRHAGRNGWKL